VLSGIDLRAIVRPSPGSQTSQLFRQIFHPGQILPYQDTYLCIHGFPQPQTPLSYQMSRQWAGQLLGHPFPQDIPGVHGHGRFRLLPYYEIPRQHRCSLQHRLLPQNKDILSAVSLGFASKGIFQVLFGFTPFQVHFFLL